MARNVVSIEEEPEALLVRKGIGELEERLQATELGQSIEVFYWSA